MYVISTSVVGTPSGWTLTQQYQWSMPGYGYYSYLFTRQVGSATNVAITTANGGAIMVGYAGASGVGAVGTFAEEEWIGMTPNSITLQSANSVVVVIVSDRDPVRPFRRLPPSSTKCHSIRAWTTR
jgi:hypothetical protein